MTRRDLYTLQIDDLRADCTSRIEDLRQRVVDLEHKMLFAESDCTKHHNRLVDVETRLTHLNQRLVDLERLHQTLRETVAALQLHVSEWLPPWDDEPPTCCGEQMVPANLSTYRCPHCSRVV